MRLLAIETSCDDTCAAVLLAEGPAAARPRALSNVVSSQLIHADYLGVVPELASREHVRLIGPVVREALGRAEVAWGDLDGIAVTNGPGLIGSLLIGLSYAKALAYGLGIPLVGVNHVEGHLAAVALEHGEERAAPPFVGLVASGGHTEIVHVRDWGRWDLLGATRDDAAGEAFDKVAKLLKLPFPGGPAISRLSAEGNAHAYPFPRAWLGMEKGGLDMSFSGLKTAVKLFLEERGWPDEPHDLTARERFVADVSASFENAVVDVLAGKLLKAAEIAGARRIVVAGGVAANVLLRGRLEGESARMGLELLLPPLSLCGDNAAMIGMAGIQRLRAGQCSRNDIAAIPNLDDWSGFYEALAPARDG
jgi:N6-L-threonylcarbamoyladenine synthase